MARVSHELKTPITPLRAYLQMLLRQVSTLPDAERAREFVQRALGQVEQLTRMVDDLLDVSRTQSGKYTLDLQPLRLDELVTSVVDVGRLLAGGQAIELAVADAPLVVAGDPGRLEQVLLNLLSNAIRYGGTGKRIDMRLRRVGDEAELQVQDYGQGLASADLTRIFTRFYQGGSDTAEGAGAQPGGNRGLGMGLFLAHEIVDAHHGSISAASTPGKGATFTVRLPLANPTPPPGGRGRGSRGR